MWIKGLRNNPPRCRVIHENRAVFIGQGIEVPWTGIELPDTPERSRASGTEKCTGNPRAAAFFVPPELPGS